MSTYQKLVDELYYGQSPYANFAHRRFRKDLQGWNSKHPFLTSTIDELNASCIIEIGVWKGGSSVHMAKHLIENDRDSVIIAVDTWLGSWEHWNREHLFNELMVSFGMPSMYFNFLANVMYEECQSKILPLALDSANASVLISQKDIEVDMIHVDAGHDYEAVYADLKRWWPILRSGGAIVADDYDPEGRVWPSVKRGIDAFLAETAHTGFEAEPYKCRFFKP